MNLIPYLPYFFTNLNTDMKSLYFFLLLIGFTACQRPIPPTRANQTPQTADNVSLFPGHVKAEFEHGIEACIYFGGGASVLLPAKGGQHEINGKFDSDLKGGWFCVDSDTGDFIHIQPNGFGRGKVGAMFLNLMPEKAELSAQ